MAARLDLPSPFGPFRIFRLLGKGGMGAVYLAEDTRLGYRVALKVPDSRDEPKLLERFQREARLAQTIHHPFICPVYEVGEVGGVHYLTMPFVEGTPLSELVSPERPWEPRRAAELVRRLALALQALHERSVIHRDLKPRNIMVKPGGEPVLMDFGLARGLAPGEHRLTSTGKPLGTPAYMSPEQVNAEEGTVGPAADVYSLGVILYELLTGSLPFEAPVTAALFYQILTATPAAPSSRRPGLDSDLEQICLKMLAKKPEGRQGSMAEVAAELDARLGLLNRPTQDHEPGTDRGSLDTPVAAHLLTAPDRDHKVSMGEVVPDWNAYLGQLEVTVPGQWQARPANDPRGEWTTVRNTPGKVTLRPAEEYQLLVSMNATDKDLVGLDHLRRARLQSVSLWGCWGVTGPGLAHLQALTALQSLNLAYTPITDAVLAELRELNGLQSLNLSGCTGVTDAGLAHLREMSALQSLRLTKTRVTDKGLAALQQALPGCRIER